MSFHGGLAGALAGGLVAAKLTGIPYLTLADLGVIGAPLGLLFGRVANFINGELWGAPTEASWGVVFGGLAGAVPRHPTQLYEALLEGIVLFTVLLLLSRKAPPRPRGTFIGVFLVLYGAFRFIIEFVREPDLQLGYLAGTWFTMGQLLSVPMMVAGALVLIYAVRKKLPQQGLPDTPTG
jgi:phosphatidylglycerol:prolipoprotein diacylglycerol transferase